MLREKEEDEDDDDDDDDDEDKEEDEEEKEVDCGIETSSFDRVMQTSFEEQGLHASDTTLVSLLCEGIDQRNKGCKEMLLQASALMVVPVPVAVAAVEVVVLLPEVVAVSEIETGIVAEETVGLILNSSTSSDDIEDGCSVAGQAGSYAAQSSPFELTRIMARGKGR